MLKEFRDNLASGIIAPGGPGASRRLRDDDDNDDDEQKRLSKLLGELRTNEDNEEFRN